MFANHIGKEYLYCDTHYNNIVRYLTHVDNTTWFCRELRPRREPFYWIKLWKAPPRFVMPWIWYKEKDDKCFKLYSTAQRSNDDDVEVDFFTKDELYKFICQLREEVAKRRALHIIGFANFHPFKKADLSLGYSICNYQCGDCEEDNYSSYYFNYKANAISMDNFERLVANRPNVTFDDEKNVIDFETNANK